MHTPFQLTSLIPSSVLGTDAITAVLLHANRVILGTEKGSLLVFDLSHASTSISPPAATLVSRHDGFTKKSIEQLGVMKELNALVCLSGGDLTLHSLPTFVLLNSFSSLTRATASLFSLSSYIHYPPPAPSRKTTTTTTTTTTHPTTSSPEIHTTLALACRRRLVLLRWTDGHWKASLELVLPHQIRGMSFDERRIVAGFSTGEYGIVTLPVIIGGGGKSGEVPILGELFTPSIMPLLEKSSKNSVVGGGLGGLGNVMGLGGLSFGTNKVERNGVVSVPKWGKGKKKEVGKSLDGKGLGSWLWGSEWGWEDGEEREGKEGEVLVVRENVAVPITSSGRPRSTTPSGSGANAVATSIIYPSEAEETLVLPPYVISLLAPPSPTPPQPAAGTSSNHLTTSTTPFPTPTLSIHSIDSLAPVQTLQLPPPKDPPSPTGSSTLNSPLPTPSTSTITARFLTVAYSASQPPILVLTSSTPSPSSSSSAGVGVGVGVGGAEQTIWIASMKSWESQIEELGRMGEWEEAIRLVRRSQVGGGELLPPTLLRRLAILHSLSLFHENRYNLAIDAFISLDISPSKVISLFPVAISGKLHLDHVAHEEIFGGRAQEKVEAALEDEERRVEEERVEEVERERGERDVGSGSPVKKGRQSAIGGAGGGGEDDDAASIRSGMTARLKGSRSWLKDPGDTLEGIAERATADRERQEKLDKKNYLRSIDELIRYLTDRRQKYSLALSALLPSTRPSPSSPLPRASGAELLELPDEPLTSLRPDQLARVAQVVDTALFKSYLATKPVMVGPLCRIENWCEVEEVEELLLGAKKYRELLDLYNGKSMHEKAVKLLRQMSEDEDDPEEKVGPTIRYLQKLGSEHLQVVFDSSSWLFETNRKAALEVFIADLEEVESLPRHATMQHLEKIGPDVCISYLEHIIHTLGEEGAEFHEKLIELYLTEVHKAKSPTEDPVYQKLLTLLESSTSYRADRMLGRLPSEDMYKVRAILLGRLGRHEGALQIYVYQLEDHATAEEYCKRVYETDPRSNIFHVLLRIYLRPRASHPLLFTPALSLISSHASSIDAIEVFDLLPPLVALSDIRVFLEKTLRRSGERSREARMVKSVGKAQVEDLEREVVQLEERKVKITEGRVCPVCSKRLGNSVIAIHSPRGEVTHYQCREKFQEMNR